MIKIQNKEVVITRENQPEIKTSYGTLISSAINIAPQGGFNVDEMRIRLKIAEAISLSEKNSTTIDVETAEMEKIKSCVKVMPWGIMDSSIVEFNDYINTL